MKVIFWVTVIFGVMAGLGFWSAAKLREKFSDDQSELVNILKVISYYRWDFTFWAVLFVLIGTWQWLF
ncbi:hypothetical protein MK805_06945 [Shimazuella sp. AN120528]|uniref:hypothetical protein n=1 Tax=Shimazuella soli TaxID=1892854 RepID=UPI001F107999|nr:hypothetical protein [Shimazuella soli]MCH5584707.1 hypothetical protein [Shimazuella soli]